MSFHDRIPLCPEILDFLATSRRIGASDGSLEGGREAFLRVCRHFTPPRPDGWQVNDLQVDALPVRLYLPLAQAPSGGWPVLLYLHGGGWDHGHLDTHDWFAHAIARRLKIAIVAVAYRLAPEHPFPASLDDSLSILHAIRAGRLSDALNPQRIVVAGDSAGGALAAGLCVRLRDQGQAQPLGQALLYPVLTTHSHQPSASLYFDAPSLSVESLAGCLSRYLPDPALREHPWAMALHAKSFEGLAPAFIGVAEYDILYDECLHYAERLQQADTPAAVHVGKGMVHGSLRAMGVAEVEHFYDALARAIEGFVRG
ncbi:alpha/beta hydrolase [Pseudomonas sp. LJDD11]|uniref:alpha/beta hydrolase n=1 Tax=Pseudomonas sp. LJDD11 TaxID=2931984 RepID=UPI00211BA3F9|nr:alpha/beta hydrolase [Pseudomonas sp. LJDD11]MCQ9424539.1 alpha/beta hydrolase [Pseudomonas sp. LJDD11]